MGANPSEQQLPTVLCDHDVRPQPRHLKVTEEEAGGQGKRNQISITTNGGWAAGRGKVRAREHGFPATEVSRCQSEPREGRRPPKRRTVEGREPHEHKLSCHKSVNTFSRVGACLAYRPLKNKKSLTAAELPACDDGTVIDIDAPSC